MIWKSLGSLVWMNLTRTNEQANVSREVAVINLFHVPEEEASNFSILAWDDQLPKDQPEIRV